MPNLRKKLPSGNALFVFEAAARCGNFTRAAEELYVSQPAVSRMLSRMEDHLGVQLFDRTRGSIELTENGKILYKKIAEGFRGIEGAIQEIEARATGQQTVELSVSTAFTTHWLMPRMRRFQQAFPSVLLRFTLISGRLKGTLGDADLGMRFRMEHETDDHCLPVMRETLLPVCNPAYLAQPSSGDTVIVMDEGEHGWTDRFRIFDSKRRVLGDALDFSDYAIVIQAALLGQGIAMGWLNIVADYLTQGALVPIEQEIVSTARLCCLVWPDHRPLRPIVADIRDWIAAEIRDDIRRVGARFPQLPIAALERRAASHSAISPSGAGVSGLSIAYAR
jgi:DNA-binding transcriptional LysR family regulator